jgi:PIN domain nuclease of toxin-antitoxin system
LIHLDTHVLVWLYAGTIDRLSPLAADLINESELVISPMVGLELQYLHEIGRLREPGTTVVSDLVARLGIRTATTSFAAVVASAHALHWTRDPFDRLIVGQSLAEGVSLLTADGRIREHIPTAIW